MKAFDYTNDAWTEDGFYLDCHHPAAGSIMGDGSPAPGEVFEGCECYGKVHAGEPVPAEVIAEMAPASRPNLTADAMRANLSVSDAAINAANAYYPDAEECEGQSGFDPDW